MSRPRCPKCRRECSTIGTRVDGDDRVRYLGCRHCNYRAPGVEIERAQVDGRKRGNSNYGANQYGRYETAR